MPDQPQPAQPAQPAQDIQEVLYYFAELGPRRIRLKTNVASAQIDSDAAGYAAVLTILSDPQTCFYRSSDQSLSTDASFSPAPDADPPNKRAPQGEQIHSYTLCWNVQTSKGWIAIELNGNEYKLGDYNSNDFVAACLTFRTGRSAFYRDGELTTAFSDATYP